MKSAYLRLHRFQRPTLGVAAAVKMTDGVISESRLAVGCVGPKAQRLAALEPKINGSSINDAKRIFAEQKNHLRDLLQPVDDLLGSAEYKLYMTCVLLGDALEQAGKYELALQYANRYAAMEKNPAALQRVREFMDYLKKRTGR
jgi:CO/xanthine dehydrogenase FAD-binding subunit